MYKVFVNEKKLTLSQQPQVCEKKLRYEQTSTFEIALDLLENTSTSELNIYGDDAEEIWSSFTHFLKVIEAAGGIIKNDHNEILFIRRLGKWDLPKGKIEKDESLENAALREVEEETGLNNMELQKFINRTFHVYKERNGKRVLKTTHWFAMNYTGNQTPIPQIEEGISEVSWKSKKQIQMDVFPETFENIKLILNDYWTE